MPETESNLVKLELNVNFAWKKYVPIVTIFSTNSFRLLGDAKRFAAIGNR